MSSTWTKMAQPVLDATDPVLVEEFTVEVQARIDALPNRLLATQTPAALLAAVRAGWETYPFPDYPGACTVRTELGWGFLSTGTGNRFRHDTDRVDKRRESLRMMAAGVFAFGTLGSYAEAILALPNSRLASGAWVLIEDRVPVEEYETLRFLHALGGAVRLPSALHLVGGLGT